MVYNYEFKEFLNHKIKEAYYESSSDLRVGVLCPAMIVAKMIEKHFGFEKILMLRIHGIDVDTQSADAITVTIKLNRPGVLIGKGGSTINSLEAELTKYFNKKTDIRIVEVKNDVNLPLYGF
jgi:ribosomal protein S3